MFYIGSQNISNTEYLSNGVKQLFKVDSNKLLGRKLLGSLISSNGISGVSLDKISFNNYGKPIIPNSNFFFNISHSHDKIAAIVSNVGEVGIDIEKIRSIPLNGFNYFFHDHEWQEIANASNPSFQLLKYWTIKEAVLKCIGTGFGNGNQELFINSSGVLVLENDSFRWCNYKTIIIDGYLLSYACFDKIASDIKISFF